MSTEDAVVEIRELHALQQIEPEFATVNKEMLIRALTAAEDAVEFIHESLARHDADLGRSLRRHNQAALYMERRIAAAKGSVNEIRSALGWPVRK